MDDAKRRRLAVFADKANYIDPPEPVDLGDVLYTPPNTDGTRKKCGNCIHWMQDVNQCYLFLPDVLVPKDAICGYHVFGTPMPKDSERRDDMQAVEPQFAGFDQVKSGTSCDRCKFYTQSSKNANFGKCSAVIDDDGASAVVDALGCCARWRRND